MPYENGVPIQTHVPIEALEFAAEGLRRRIYGNDVTPWSQLHSNAKLNWVNHIKGVMRDISQHTPEEGAGPDPAP